MKIGDCVHVITTNSIGHIIDMVEDRFGEWIKTDVDGVRNKNELVLLPTPESIKECIECYDPFIANSTRLKLGL
jgi:reverse gyrase